MISLGKEFLIEYLREELEDDEMELPDDISLDDLADAFMDYLEVDIYDWLRENYRSFFKDHDWDWVRERIR